MQTLKRPALYSHLHPKLVVPVCAAFVILLSPSAQAAGTTAGTQISNTATATYEDPNNPGNPITTTSNEVIVTISEIAGITNVPSPTIPVVDTTPATPILQSDTLQYNFVVTNVGNDPTQIFIPGSSNINVTGPGTISTVEYSTNGGSSYTTIPAGGTTIPSVNAEASVLVRVSVTVSSSAVPGQTIQVRLGDTAPNDNSAGTQNQPSTGTTSDVRTVDNPGTTPAGEIAGSPVGGEKEAAALSPTAAVNAQLQAFATILKFSPVYNNAGTANILTDDTLVYGLSLEVEAPSPLPTGYASGALAGVTVNGIGSNRVLVSDKIPAGTVFNPTPAPVAPSNWTVVYSTTTTGDALSATWTTVQPPAASITRVGFVYDVTANGPITDPTTITGFSFTVSPDSSFTGGEIANIAQVFGSTQGVTSANPVFDESGDQLPSNFTDTNGDGTIDSNSVPDPFDPQTNTGTANVNDPDPTGTNTGTTADGESNVFTVSQLLNGPNGAPAAVGPTSNNDDFTNQTVNPGTVPPGGLIDPAASTYTNTLSNPGTSPITVTLVPTPPAVLTDLPSGTTVTINGVVFTYNGTVFTTTGTPPDVVVPAGGTANYTVVVNLPAGTPLSTDTGEGFPVPITGFIDTNNDNIPGATEASNITIDRVYTGYLKLVKQSQILQGTGPAVVGNDGTLSTLPKTPSPGNIIVYQIAYTNIADDPSGLGSVTLNASNIVITEDGTTGGNTWALDNDGNGIVDTSAIVGTTTATAPGLVTFTPAEATATKYVDTISPPATIPPAGTGTFTFQRKVN